MNEFPKMLYIYPAKGSDVAVLQDGAYGTLVVHSKDEEEAAEKDGWHATSVQAKQAYEAPKPEVESKDDTPPTRAELEQKANELEIKFDGRTPDRKLAALIAGKLGA